MVLENGCIVLVVHRRLYADDPIRYFAGMVEGYEAGVARVTGYSWIADPFGGWVVRKEERRTKILSISSGTLLVYQLPSDIRVEDIRIERDKSGQIALSAQKFRMDLTERLIHH